MTNVPVDRDSDAIQPCNPFWSRDELAGISEVFLVLHGRWRCRTYLNPAPEIFPGFVLPIVIDKNSMFKCGEIEVRDDGGYDVEWAARKEVLHIINQLVLRGVGIARAVLTASNGCRAVNGDRDGPV